MQFNDDEQSQDGPFEAQDLSNLFTMVKLSSRDEVNKLVRLAIHDY